MKFKVKSIDVLQAVQMDSSKISQDLLQGVIDVGGSFPDEIILEGEPLKEEKKVYRDCVCSCHPIMNGNSIEHVHCIYCKTNKKVEDIESPKEEKIEEIEGVGIEIDDIHLKYKINQLIRRVNKGI